MAFKVESLDIKEGGRIARSFTCEAEDTSPEIIWHDPPKGVKGYALITEDPDAPAGTFTHWVLYDIPASLNKLERGIGNPASLKDGMKHGVTDFGAKRYNGPCPPKGHGIHRYYFILRALDVATLGLSAGAKKNDVEKAMKGHIIGEARLMGTYSR
ncbi:MAG: YbhB/YbcL family Raf kinase inhibitor-like protein [Deltaproteobacteria bacterium]|nr:YbhB/YbcL family Raf kinase inhibitor-like protein [Deltaproteobacteria bacterium]